MPYSDPAKNGMLTWLASQVTHLSVHTTVPSLSSGDHEATGGSPAYARKVPAFGTPVGGILPLSSALNFDVPAGTYGYVGMWVSTTFYGYGVLPVARVFSTQDVLVVSNFRPNLNYLNP